MISRDNDATAEQMTGRDLEKGSEVEETTYEFMECGRELQDARDNEKVEERMEVYEKAR